MAKKRIRVALVLGPGGYAGAWLVGFFFRIIRYCMHKDYGIVFIGGASVGAVIGGKIAEADNLKDMLAKCVEARRMFRAIEVKGPMAIFPFHRFSPYQRLDETAITTGIGLENLISGKLLDSGPVDAKKIVANREVVYAAGSMDEETGEPIFTTNRDKACVDDPNHLGEKIYASAAAAPFIPPKRFGEAVLGDSGEVPMENALATNPHVVIVGLPYPKKDARLPSARNTSWLQKWIAKLQRAWPFRTARMLGHLVRRLNDSVIDAAIANMKHLRACKEPASVILKYQMSVSRPSLLSYTFKEDGNDLSWAMRQGYRDAGPALVETDRLIELLVHPEE